MTNPKLFWGESAEPGVQPYGTEVTLRDLFAAMAPMPDERAWAYISDREAQRRTRDARRTYVTPSSLALAAEYRYEIADAMLAEREK